MRGIVLLGFDIEKLGKDRRPVDAAKLLREKLTGRQGKPHWKPKVRWARGSKDEGHDCIEVEYTIPGRVDRVGASAVCPVNLYIIENEIAEWKPVLMYVEISGVRSE